MHLKIRRMLAVVPAILLAYTLHSHAQRPALTQSVDEPGRTPYADSQTVNCFSPVFLVDCGITFKPVPPGYRLVVTHASLYFAVNRGAAALAYLTEDKNNSFEYLPAPGLVYASTTPDLDGQYSNYYTVSAPLTFYAEPNGRVRVHVSDPNSKELKASLTGYLVAIP